MMDVDLLLARGLALQHWRPFNSHCGVWNSTLTLPLSGREVVIRISSPLGGPCVSSSSSSSSSSYPLQSNRTHSLKYETKNAFLRIKVSKFCFVYLDALEQSVWPDVGIQICPNSSKSCPKRITKVVTFWISDILKNSSHSCEIFELLL